MCSPVNSRVLLQLQVIWSFSIDGVFALRPCWNLISTISTVESGSGVNRVGVTRGGKWGCHPYFFPENNWRPFLFITVCQFLRCYAYLFSPKNWRPFSAHHCHFSWFHSGVTPWRVSLRTFLPVRPRLSTILCKFAHNFLEGATRGGLPPMTPLESGLTAADQATTQFYALLKTVWTTTGGYRS